jgi:DNA-binding MarR family transcriptional regulator
LKIKIVNPFILNKVNKNLDPIFLSQSRLSIIGLLYQSNELEFTQIKDALKLTAGNLSAQIQKLKRVDYLEIEKKFKKNYPQTVCRITPKGIIAFEDFITNMNQFTNSFSFIIPANTDTKKNHL